MLSSSFVVVWPYTQALGLRAVTSPEQPGQELVSHASSASNPTTPTPKRKSMRVLPAPPQLDDQTRLDSKQHTLDQEEVSESSALPHSARDYLDAVTHLHQSFSQAWLLYEVSSLLRSCVRLSVSISAIWSCCSILWSATLLATCLKKKHLVSKP
jgi:hypothetical protein